MPATMENLFRLLDELGIRTVTAEHEALFTVEQSRRLRGEIPGAHSKNLFLKDRKGQLWLVVAEEETAVDLKRLHAVIGSARLSFGKPDLLIEALGIAPGSVTPFALINDRQGRVAVVLDAHLMRHDRLNFHPLVNTATTTISRDDLLAFIRATGHEPQIVDLAAAAA